MCVWAINIFLFDVKLDGITLSGEIWTDAASDTQFDIKSVAFSFAKCWIAFPNHRTGKVVDMVVNYFRRCDV